METAAIAAAAAAAAGVSLMSGLVYYVSISCHTACT